MRVSYDELKKMCGALGTDRLNSWSRLNCAENSLYEYYLNYIYIKKRIEKIVFMLLQEGYHMRF